MSSATITRMVTILRRRRLRTRIALVVVALLLWSQTALAWHVACRTLVAQAANASVHHEMVGMPDHETSPHEQVPSALCAAHCDQGVPSPDTARIPALPALPALIPAPALAFQPAVSLLPRRVETPPPVPWHRPTPHPAALLLI